MEKIIFFGAGKYAKKHWKQVEEHADFVNDEYLAFCDNNASLWGNSLFGMEIISPQDIKMNYADIIVITSRYQKDICRQLIEELNIPETKIYSFDEYTRKQYARWIYTKRYGDKMIQTNEKNRTKKVVVYTAITKGYDDLKEPALINDDITYVCITNDPALRSKTWNIEYINNVEKSDVLFARKIKAQPHIYFPDFETSVWVDGKFKINSDIREYINKYQRDSAMLCFPHYQRECIYDEMATCLYLNKGKKQDLLRQIVYYYQDKYPFNNGLYETGCLVRNHNDDLCKKTMCEWKEEIEKYSVRDQISLPYILWKNNLKPDICDLDVRKNKWLTICNHNDK